MVKPRVELDPDYLFIQANKTNQVQAAVLKRATRMATRARTNLTRNKLDASVKVSPHRLATGRASYNVNVQAESDKDAARVKRVARRSFREVRR